ncbi:unnamed protein product [Urochloa decumbens]|uniref:Uncharacterized protein n=1 Tax=Urochloa decumbens TaxID=240449 RepID=A0ABC9C970_9POAL
MSSASGSGSGRGKPSRSSSTIVAGNVGGYHDLKIDGYSRIKGLPTGVLLRSSPFTLKASSATGGHRWSIAFYPNGRGAESEGYISLSLILDEALIEFEEEEEEEEEGEVMAQFQFAFMVEHRDPFFRKRTEKVNSRSSAVRRFRSYGSFVFEKFIKRSFLEESTGAIKNDSLTIRCDIVVLDDLGPEEEAAAAEATAPTTFVPPPDLHRHLADLLKTGKGADVVFQVGGEMLPAHGCVLAARSPVFSAEFFGAMKESDNNAGGVVRVDDMDAQVFKALLCFLYTDLLPEMSKKDEDVMYQHMLVAADRYGIERLKLICEDKLCKYIDVGKVATVLTLAEQHNCHWLKKACLDFLSAPAILKAVMASDGFEHLSSSCPSLKTALVAMLAS